jgi:hypothetical protein
MIILSATTDKLVLVMENTAETFELPVVASWRNITTTTFAPNKSVVPTNGSTQIDVVVAPASNNQRLIDYISVFNRDTKNHTVTISYSLNGVLFQLFKATIAIGEKIEYTSEGGFKVLTNGGGIKQGVGNVPTSSTLNTVVLSADVAITDAIANVIKDVTGLSFPVNAGKTYYFKAFIEYESSATTNGSRWAVTGPTLTRLAIESKYSLAATTQTINQGVSGYDLPAAANATSLLVGNTASIEGFITCSANGVVQIRAAQEVAAATITAKAGSVLQWQEVL